MLDGSRCACAVSVPNVPKCADTDCLFGLAQVWGEGVEVNHVSKWLCFCGLYVPMAFSIWERLCGQIVEVC